MQALNFRDGVVEMAMMVLRTSRSANDAAAADSASSTASAGGASL